MTARPATAADREAVVGTVVAAFAQDPAWRFMLGDDYDRLAPLFAGALVDLRLPDGTVWLAQEGTSVALWESPGGVPRERAERVWAEFRAEAGEGTVQRVDAYDDALALVTPREPHWYLGVLATRPERQGEGLASAVLAPVLAWADHDGLPCCLETSTPGNKAFYAGRGFTAAVPVAVPDGPPTWWLTRAPVR